MHSIAARIERYDHHTEGFPTLPDGMERDGFIRLFENVAPTMFNLTDAEISTFVRMAEDPRPSDWKSPDREPCCYRRQGEIAARRSKSRYSIARHEKRLADVGLIDKRTMAHGGRSGFDGCGVFFSCAIALVPAMLAHQHQQDALNKERNLLCNTRSIHKGHLKAAINDLADLGADTSQIEAEYEAWPDARQLRRIDMDDLRQHVAEADLLTQQTIILLDETQNMQHGCSTSATPYIQDTTQDFNPVCNASVDKRSAGKPAHSGIVGSEPNGPEHCEEKDDEKSCETSKGEIRLKLSGPILYGLASPDMQLYIDARTCGRQPTEHDVSAAAVQMLPELGINQTAWRDACEVMGHNDALLALIITDANRFTPEIRVQNPGGYLRGMTNAARNGTLNLVGSLKALAERKDQQNR
jgi:replication initiation protein RepC